jgi:co-chaperonin GroES (HSP10)
MPIPEPTKKQSKKEFISQCMGNPTMNKEFPDQAQRFAVCNTKWDDKKKGAKAEVKIGGDELIFY